MKPWAQRIIARFMNGIKVDPADLEEACRLLGLTPATIATCRSAALTVTRGLAPQLVLTPMGGQRLARAR